MNEVPLALLRFIVGTLVLFHVSIAAGDLSDKPFFLFCVMAMGGLGFALRRYGIRPRWAIPSLVLLPMLLHWAIYAVALSVPFRSSSSVGAVLLGFDRNFLVAGLPAVWAGASAYWSFRRPRFCRVETVLNGILLIGAFSFFPDRLADAYGQPVWIAVAVAAIAALELTVLAAANGARGRSSFADVRGAALPAFAVCSLIVVFFLGAFEDNAIRRGGGLLKPSLLKSDFSQFLRLEGEISLSDDLALIVKKRNDDAHVLLRRFVLSAYSRKQGFLPGAGDEAAQPARLSPVGVKLPSRNTADRKPVEQDFYLVNFDADAVLALNEPTRILPLPQGPGSSFISVYRAESEVSFAMPFELANEVPGGNYAAAKLDLGDKAYKILTDYGGDERIAAFAQEIAPGSGYWDRVQAVFERLHYGEYRYSLKPGISGEGDQIGRFLFEAKKGYCSYFAFSMALMVRSLGIPARVAVGFYINPSTGVFDYYPVRANMAHAWVEVYFPKYGWIEYDPTSDVPADGEDPRAGLSGGDDHFEKLLQEILTNRDGMKPVVASGTGAEASITAKLLKLFGNAVWRYWIFVVLALYFALSLRRRAGLYLLSLVSQDPRSASAELHAHALRRLSWAGFVSVREEHPGEFALRVDRALGTDFVGMNEDRRRFAYAEAWTRKDAEVFADRYRRFNEAYNAKVSWVRRAAAWILPFRFRRWPHSMAVCLLVSLAVFAVPGDTAYAVDPGVGLSADELLKKGEAALGAEKWEAAVASFEAGKRAFPKDLRFCLSLGDLYSEKKMYSLAWAEYRNAESKGPPDAVLLHKLATSAGHLNEDAVSAGYLERALEKIPDDRELIGDLAWMYFKLHKLRNGERLLLDSLERFGPDAGLSMTLGTIYSELYEYDASKRWYQKSIDDSKAKGSKIFLAVARYNLSILESRFYKYAEAYDQTRLSLLAADRASGHLARGELYLKRQEFGRTYSEYQKAYALDVSPLSKVNLADAYRRAGRLKDAAAYAEQALRWPDTSWMINYGTNRDQFLRDVNEILASSMEGLAECEGLSFRTGLADWVSGLFNGGIYRAKAEYHRALQRKYALACARELERSGQRPDSWNNYFSAFSAYPRLARPFLEQSRGFEVPLVPASASAYDADLGALEKDAPALLKAVAALDPEWQRDVAVDALAQAGSIAGPSLEPGRTAVEEVFALNRGATRQAGLRVPATVRVSGPNLSASDAERVAKAVSAVGFQRMRDADVPRFDVSVSLRDGRASVVLTDGMRGAAVFEASFLLLSVQPVDLKSFSSKLAEAIFVNP